MALSTLLTRIDFARTGGARSIVTTHSIGELSAWSWQLHRSHIVRGCVTNDSSSVALWLVVESRHVAHGRAVGRMYT